MSCPFKGNSSPRDPAQDGVNRLEEEGGASYGSYLQLSKLLNAQQPVTKAHDEHLFIITHQAFELWFKQIIFEIDSIKDILSGQVWGNEQHMLAVVTRLNRVVSIIKLINEQFGILETMSPLNFMEFRGYLAAASGFQSLQFRILENKLGLRDAQRVKYNQQNYSKVFTSAEDQALLKESIETPSLLDLVQRWLEQTPGLDDFWQKYCTAVTRFLDEDYRDPAAAEEDENRKQLKQAEYLKEKDAFDTILIPEKYNMYVARGERRLNHKAFQGAMMVMLNDNQPRFHSPSQILTLLMDFDAMLIKWRYNHVIMVQRMIGSKLGTGGSSGYQYLRSTISDRYKVFVDLFNLATYLLPRSRCPELSQVTQDMLRTTSFSESPDSTNSPNN